MENHEKGEWGGWKIVSHMLSNPDKHGIYPTSKCYEELYQFVVDQKEKERKSIIEIIDKMERCNDIGNQSYSYNEALQELKKRIDKK